jgi:PAS domain-containing protein
MTVQSQPDLSEFAEFAETLRGDRIRSERIVRRALRRVGQETHGAAAEELTAVSRAFDGTLGRLDRAAEEIRVQNEALFEARMELEATSAFFCDLFERAPSAYLVTSPDTRIRYANEAACSILRRRKNALAGKPLICFVPLEDRNDFRSAVIRAGSAATVSQWPISLFPSGAMRKLRCRACVRVVADARLARALYWNILEETDEDFF